MNCSLSGPQKHGEVLHSCTSHIAIYSPFDIVHEQASASIQLPFLTIVSTCCSLYLSHFYPSLIALTLLPVFPLPSLSRLFLTPSLSHSSSCSVCLEVYSSATCSLSLSLPFFLYLSLFLSGSPSINFSLSPLQDGMLNTHAMSLNVTARS